MATANGAWTASCTAHRRWLTGGLRHSEVRQQLDNALEAAERVTVDSALAVQDAGVRQMSREHRGEKSNRRPRGCRTRLSASSIPAG